MKTALMALALLGSAALARAQQPDTARARADSAARARADSLRLVRELEAALGDTARRRMSPLPPVASPRMLPDISAIADLVGDLSPKGSTQEDGARFTPRELEIAIGANVDPYFRADFVLGLSDAEGAAIEEAYGTALALPGQFQARLGRFHMPVGKQNPTHRAELHTLEYPYVIQRFLGEEALKGTGVWVSKLLAPFGFYQELIVTAVNRFGDEHHGEEEAEDGTILVEGTEPPNRELGGLGYSARFRNYWDLSEAANVELSASAITGLREQPLQVALLPLTLTTTNARQTVVAGDLTIRWRPLQQGLYRSFILQAEFMRQLNERVAAPEYLGPMRDFSGAYAFARWQLTRRLHLGGRYDWLEDPELAGETLTAGSGYLEWFPSEFSKMVVAFERRVPAAASGVEATNRILLQATFAVGPHRPHPF